MALVLEMLYTSLDADMNAPAAITHSLGIAMQEPR